MIRFVSILLVFCLFFFGFGTSVSAVSHSIPARDVVDFLTYYSYDLLFGNLSYTGLSSPFYSVSGASSYSYRWDCTVTSSFESFFITILASAKPSSVYFSSDFNFNSSVAFTFVSSSTASNGLNRYIYRLDSPPSLKSYFYVRCNFDSTYAGTLAIDSFYGLQSNIVSLRYHKYSYNRVFKNKNADIGVSDTFIYDNFSTGSGNLASWCDQSEWYGEFPTHEAPLRLDASYTLPLSSLTLGDYAYLYFTCAPSITGDIGVFLVDNYGMVKATPSFELSTLGITQNYYNTTFGSLDITHYAVIVDLSGYDLSSFSLQLNFSVPYVLTSAVEEIVSCYACLTDCFVSLPKSDTTESWYYPIVKFFSNLLNTIISWIQDIYYTISDGFDSVFSWLEQIYTELAGDPEDSKEFEDQTAQNKENLGNLSGQLEDVSKPNVNSIDVSIDSYVPAEGITLLTTPFNIIFGNSYIFKILSLSLILGLVSYALFGKR